MSTKAELYDRAGELGIASRDSMTKSQLANAVMERESKGNPIEEPTPNQNVEAKGKSPEDLVKDVTGDNPQKSNAASRELKSREEKAKQAKPVSSNRREMPQQYVVTKRCVLSVNGFLTDLAEDSIISARTHNLNQIKQSGGEYEECKGTRLVRNQFGQVLTVPIK